MAVPMADCQPKLNPATYDSAPVECAHVFYPSLSPRRQNRHIEVPAAVADHAVDADVDSLVAFRRQHADGATVGVGQAQGEPVVRRVRG